MVFQVCHQISLITTNTLMQLKHWLLNIKAAFSCLKLSNGAVLMLAGLLESESEMAGFNHLLVMNLSFRLVAITED